MSTTTSNSALCAKFRGTFVGALVGDVIGAYFEGTSPDGPIPIVEVAKYTGGINKNGRSLPFTDDTSMTISVAESLIACKAFNGQDMAARLSEKFFADPSRGFGGSVTNVFAALRDRGTEDWSGPATRQFGGAGSYGNGGAMRTAPIVLFSPDEWSVTQEIVINCSRITHAHVDGVDGAALQAHAIFLALHSPLGMPLDGLAFVDSLLDSMKDLEKDRAQRHLGGPLEEEAPYSTRLLRMRELLADSANVDSARVVHVLGNSVEALQSVPAAIYSFLHCAHLTFADALNFSISLGGDTDTIACMTGAIAGAYWGASSIPDAWQARSEGLETALSLADYFYNAHIEKK